MEHGIASVFMEATHLNTLENGNALYRSKGKGRNINEWEMEL